MVHEEGTLEQRARVRLSCIAHPGAVRVTHAREPLPLHLPCWERGSAPAPVTRPAVFEIGAGAPVLTVRLEVGGADPAGTYTLSGEHAGGARFSGRVSGAALAGGPVDVEVAREDAPARFDGLDGEVVWTLRGEDGPVGAARTHLELYWIPSDACTLFARGVPVELLRAIRGALAAAGGRGLVPALVDWCFRRNPPRYDVWQGAYYFIDIPRWPAFEDLTLHLSRYLAAIAHPDALCNCYDQAAVLQVLLRVAGMPGVRYCFLRPFGYLALAELVGRGLTNDPLYDEDGEQRSEIIGETDPRRTYFGNHAFCMLPDEQTVGDATAGPHLADQDLRAYLRAAIDPTTPEPPALGSGEPENVRHYGGVTTIDTVAPIVAAPQETAAFATLVGMDVLPATAGGVVCAWPDLRAFPPLSGWTVEYDETLLGPTEGQRYRRLRRGAASVVVAIHVAHDAATARRRFLAHGTIHSAPGPVFAPAKDGLGHFGAEFAGRGRRRLLWTYENVTFDVQATFDPRAEAPPDLAALKRWLQGLAEAAWVPDPARHRPVIEDVTVSPRPVAVGARVDVAVKHTAGALVEPRHDGGALRLLGDTGGTFTFRARRPGHSVVTVIVADPRTLLVASTSVTVTAR